MEIWKFELTSSGQVEMPEGAEALSVHAIRERPYLWALVDPEAPQVTRKFKIVGTGFPMDEAGKFLGTFFLGHLPFVFHVFDPSSR